MSKFYAVTSTFDNRGRVTAAITSSKECANCPESTFTSTSRKDIYIDWYSDYDEAVQAVEDVRRA